MPEGRNGPYDQPLDVETCDGEVVITGPGRVGIALTGPAAAETAERLAAAAASVRSGAEAQAGAVASQDSVSDD